MDRAALYLRLSKEDADKMDKGDDSESIVNQRLLLTDYAISHHFCIADVYSDDDYSGLYDDRPEFDRLIRDSRLGKFNVVIAKTQSRFTRNMEHMEKYLHHDFMLLGIRFIGVVDGVDTQNAANKKSRQINGLVNEWYCEDLSNNIRAVFHQKRKAGQFLGSFAPYGYKKDPDDRYQLIVDKEAAAVVKNIYDLFLAGYSIKGICHFLEEEGIPNPTIYKARHGLSYKNARAESFGVKYGFWSTTTIRQILSNETYIGTLIQGKVQKASYKDKRIIPVPKENWDVFRDHHEPIIDKATYDRALELLKKRRISVQNPGNGRMVHVFAGKIRCRDCGHTMIRSGGGDKYGNWYLRCQLSNKSRQKECTTHSIKYSALYEIVLTKIRDIISGVNLDGLCGRDTSEVISGKSGRVEAEDLQKKIQKRKEEITKAVKVLYLDRICGKIKEELFFSLKEQLETELSELENKSVHMGKGQSQTQHAGQSGADYMESSMKGLKFLTDNSELTHELVNDFIDRIEIGEKENKKQRIFIYWNF